LHNLAGRGLEVGNGKTAHRPSRLRTIYVSRGTHD
jgi:hypothetical protein